MSDASLVFIFRDVLMGREIFARVRGDRGFSRCGVTLEAVR